MLSLHVRKISLAVQAKHCFLVIRVINELLVNCLLPVTRTLSGWTSTGWSSAGKIYLISAFEIYKNFVQSFVKVFYKFEIKIT